MKECFLEMYIKGKEEVKEEISPLYLTIFRDYVAVRAGGWGRGGA